ncbi:MAG TPA: tetratricopeptide repeat protein [Ktedonobacterales bacterium]
MSLSPRLYCCAAPEDDAWCRALVEALRWAGADVLADAPDASAPEGIERTLVGRPVCVAVLSPAAALAPAVRQAVEVALRLRHSAPERLVLGVTAAPMMLPAAWATIERIAAADGGGLAPAEAAQRVRDRLADVALRTPASSMPLVVVPDQEARARDAWERGKVLRAEGRPQEALALYDHVLAADPALAPIWYSRGTLLAELERYDEALIALERALACDASLAVAWHARGSIHLALHAPNDALPAFEHALRLNPTHVPSWAGKGDAFTQQRRYADALEAYERALELDGDNADLWNRKGNTLQMLRRHPESPPARSRARTLGGNAPQHEDRDWDREALAAYVRATDRDPKHALAWANIIRLLEEQGRHRAARAARRDRDRDRALEEDVAAQPTRYTPRAEGAEDGEYGMEDVADQRTRQAPSAPGHDDA